MPKITNLYVEPLRRSKRRIKKSEPEISNFPEVSLETDSQFMRSEHSSIKALKDQFSRDEILLIKEAMRFFARLNAGEDESIPKMFKVSHRQFFAMSHDIFNKIHNLLIGTIPSAEYLSRYEQILTVEDLKPIKRDIPKETTLIQNLQKMSRSERKIYFENYASRKAQKENAK